MGTSTAWGRIAEDGTVYVRTADEGERVVGSWQAGTPEEGLAHFVRRYDDLATEVGLLETRLASGAASASSTVVAVTKLRASLPTANAVGDLPTLDVRLCTLLAAAEAKRADERAAKAAATTKAVDAKKALADEAEKLAQSTQWKPAGDRLRAIVDEWKEIKGVDRKIDTELWKRVSAARAEFGRRRGAHFATLDEQRKEAVAYKEKLATEAESLAQSTEWTPTANRYKSLMVQWKAAARASKDVDEALWQRFRTAQDTFFTRRTAALEEREAEFRTNQHAKEALLAEAEAIDPSSDLPVAQAKLRDIQTRWAATGRAPREVAADFDRRLDAVAERLKTASEDQWRETSLSSSPLAIRLRESVEKLEKKIDRAKQAGKASEVTDLEAQLATQREWLAQSERPAR
ncbi:MAG TPA: DUF349 domain-containing protein [Acidothermaceae bacterium]|nr:DUF349 domain-containing protein [Acidothermaceae bacterium]